jgi:tetratricopeptide (TPR) repeat protein
LISHAIELSQQALNIDPKRGEAAVNIAYAQYMRGHHRQALDYFHEIGQKFPTNAALFLNYGYILYREYLDGRTDLLQDAIDETRRAWELDQKSYIAANNLGFLYFEVDNLKEAIKYWNEAFRLNHNDPDVLIGLALGLFKSDQCDEAVDHYREAIRREGEKIRDPGYLRSAHFWSEKAAQAVIPLVQRVTIGCEGVRAVQSKP